MPEEHQYKYGPFATIEEATGFIDGVNFVNDSSVKCIGKPFKEHMKGWYVLIQDLDHEPPKDGYG